MEPLETPVGTLIEHLLTISSSRKSPILILEARMLTCILVVVVVVVVVV